MTAKAQEKKNETQEPILYDSRLNQTVPFTLTRSGRDYPLTHTLRPITDERYFKLQLETEQLGSKVKTLSSAIYAPKRSLWAELVESTTGYKERADWKEKMHESDAIATVNAMLHALVVDESEMDEDPAAEGLFDIDALTPVEFRALQSGKLLTLTHYFRPETKSELDQFLAIETGEPIPDVMASAQKLSRAERLYDLGKEMVKDRKGYADGSDIPAWHLATTTESFFLRQMARMGKSLQP